MFQATFIDNNGEKSVAQEISLCVAGIIVPTGNHSEVLIPWHRVHDVTSSHRGAIRFELGE